MNTDTLYFIIHRNTKEILTHTTSEKRAKEILWSWGDPEYLKISKSKIKLEDVGHYVWKE